MHMAAAQTLNVPAHFLYLSLLPTSCMFSTTSSGWAKRVNVGNTCVPCCSQGAKLPWLYQPNGLQLAAEAPSGPSLARAKRTAGNNVRTKKRNTRNIAEIDPHDPYDPLCVNWKIHAYGSSADLECPCTLSLSFSAAYILYVQHHKISLG